MNAQRADAALRRAALAAALLLSACGVFEAPPTPTATAWPPTAAPPSPTPGEPTPLPYMECGWQWATQPLPDQTARLLDDLEAQGLAAATASAYAFGENCLDREGNINHFAAMQTDYEIVLDASAETLASDEATGAQAAAVIAVLAGYGTEDTPGPMPGRVTLTFQGPDGARRTFQFGIEAAQDAAGQGLSGAALLTFLEGQE